MSKPTGQVIAENATWLSIVTQLFGTRMVTLLKPHGLTLGQFGILHHVTQVPVNKSQRVSDIAAAVEVGQPAVTKALHKFQTMGLVRLDDDLADRRATLVFTLPEATALLGRIQQSIYPDLSDVFASLAAEDAQELARLLKALGQWLDQNRLKPS